MGRKSYKYHYFYKITNLINNHFYYGVHNTDNLDDGYMGSGTRINYAYKEFGIENFKKEILKYFGTSEEAFEYEAEVVTEELIKSDECYNVIEGGNYGWEKTKDTISVRDKDGNCFRIHKDSEEYKNKIVLPVTIGHLTVKDDFGNTFYVSCDDQRYLSGELKHCCVGHIHAKDKNGNHYYITKDDPRWMSGELVGMSKGRKYTEEQKQHVKEGIKGKNRKHKTRFVCNENEIIKIDIKDLDEYLKNGYQVGKKYHKIVCQKLVDAHKKFHFQAGEKNSQYGTCWIHNDKENKKIKKIDLENYINNGWLKGMKMKLFNK